MREELDVVVVGAGPAGTAAAITAVGHGLRVVCVDKAGFPRDKTCGDGVTAHALRLLQRLGLTGAELAATDPAVVRETVFVSPSGRYIRLPMPGDGLHGVVVPRAQLDAALVALARRRGVDLREAHEVEKVVVHDDGVQVDGLFARHVIAADGHWSPVRRAVAPDAPRDLGEWHAVRQYFDGVADDRLWAFFERDLLPGYAWVFPLPGGRANVGYGVLRDAHRRGRDLKQLWPDVLARPALRAVLGPGARPTGPMRAWPIPTRYSPGRLAHGRVLFAGDAAGVVDPLTGEGIAQAIETGMLAARAVATGADYRRLVHRALGRDLRFAAFLQAIMRSPHAATAAFATVDLTEWTRRNFARWMWEDYPRALLGTPDRWRRGVFAPRGAFME
ncbi:MAG TPA: geranylgeranyl reductase family protein [Acidimicrobiia bacterium]|nr:geranylgeranyl reductase family protein [Acidimicrobiia bacterium]